MLAHEQRSSPTGLDQRIDGVVFSRRHWRLLKMFRRTRSTNTSSPLRRRQTRIDAAERDNPDLVPGAARPPVRTDPACRAAIAAQRWAYDSDGALLWRRVAANDLRFPPDR
jgi:hypothetical protein